MARRGIAVPAARLQRDWTEPYAADEGVKQAWPVSYTHLTLPTILLV